MGVFKSASELDTKRLEICKTGKNMRKKTLKLSIWKKTWTTAENDGPVITSWWGEGCITSHQASDTTKYFRLCKPTGRLEEVWSASGHDIWDGGAGWPLPSPPHPPTSSTEGRMSLIIHYRLINSPFMGPQERGEGESGSEFQEPWGHGALSAPPGQREARVTVTTIYDNRLKYLFKVQKRLRYGGTTVNAKLKDLIVIWIEISWFYLSWELNGR